MEWRGLEPLGDLLSQDQGKKRLSSSPDEQHLSGHNRHQYQPCASSALCHFSSSFIQAGIEGAVWSVTPQSQGGLK